MKGAHRLTEARGANTDDYLYTAGTSGNTALLDHVDLAGGAGGSREYEYTPAGHVVEVDAGANVVDFIVGEEGRLGGLERIAGGASSNMLYDGRGFLSRVEGFNGDDLFRDGFERGTTECWTDGVPTPPSPGAPCPGGFRLVQPVYDSGGLLHALGITDPLLGESAERVLYLAGRPVAIVRGPAAAPDVLSLTTDHLGTPVAACDESGTLAWSGGFEPFGTDWLEGTIDGASKNDVWLRFPGQWVDRSWELAGVGGALSHNLNRWYDGALGRFASVDPLGTHGSDAVAGVEPSFAISASNPLLWVDPSGLLSVPPPDRVSPRCRRRLLEKVLPEIDRVLNQPRCTGFFCDFLGVDAPALFGSGVPFLEVRDSPSRGGVYTCGISPLVISVGRDSLCRQPVSEAVRVILHEFTHFADCQFNGDQFPPVPYKPEEGCAAENACLGGSIGNNCVGLGYARAR